MPDDLDKFFREIQTEFLVHELKNPISIVETAIRALLEQREKNGPLSDRQEKTLNRALRNSKKIRMMLDDLLEIGRSEAGFFEFSSFQPSSLLLDLLYDMLETLPGNLPDQPMPYGKKEKIEFLMDCGIYLEVLPEADGVEIRQDKTKFIQVAGNLIQNALHYRREWVEIKLTLKNDGIYIQVADDGPGINPDQQQAVFQRYSRLNQEPGFSRKGHGLGLTGARIMARSLGGDIEITSGEGQGAVFNLFLPFKKKDVKT